MRGQSTTDRARLKAIMWETVILRFLQDNGFIEMDSVDNIRTRREREQFLEMRGRGCWHQIDRPCDYSTFMAFINPIRLLGEVKFHSVPIKKHDIREFVGALKDIQENYFAPDDASAPSERYTELGVFFSASGFEGEAEKLAYAHNIKTVSHKNVWLLEPLKRLVEELERNYLSTRLFKQCLQRDQRAMDDFRQRFQPADGFEAVMARLTETFRVIRSTFVATTSGGALLHFVSDEDFPEALFSGTDTQLTRVFYFSENRQRYFYLTFTEDAQQRRFFFNPPRSLEMAAFYGQREVIGQKRKIFKSIHTTRHVTGLSRNLVLKLDTDWLDAVERKLR
jgi:hypothetical protein